MIFMNRKATTLIMFAALSALLCSCRRQGGVRYAPGTFKTEVRMRTTPVKDQGKSSLCWAYAMLATIETEHIMRGDSLNLSVTFLARKMLEEQVERAYLARGRARITTRGIAADALRLMECHGAMPYDTWHDDADYNLLARKLQVAARAAGAHKTGLGRLMDEAGQIMDSHIGAYRTGVYMYGAEYTPVEFARSLFRHGEYEALTSFTHRPFGERMSLEVPDNRHGNTMLNVPVDTLAARVVKALRSGHPVCWEGDASSPGFSFARGIAVLSDETRAVTQESRQRAFDTMRTTDDHCMEIVGIATDSSMRRFFICKNSWGTANPYGGFMYMSEGYLRMNTLAVWYSSYGG